MKNTFIEIIRSSIANNLDPVTQVMEYMREKDSRITRSEAEVIVAKYRDEKPEWTAEQIMRNEG